MQKTKFSRVPRQLPPLVLQIIAVVLTIVMLLPLAWTVILSLEGRQDIYRYPHPVIPFVDFTPTLVNWQRIFEERFTTTGFVNSLIVAAVSAVVAVIIGTMTGYGLARVRSRATNRGLILWLVSQRFIPPILSALPLFLLLRQLSLLDTLPRLILSHITLVLPFAILIMRDHFSATPRIFYEAAQIEGGNFFQEFRHVALPNAGAALIASAAVCFIFSWKA